jgi:hypothetical protein
VDGKFSAVDKGRYTKSDLIRKREGKRPFERP